MVSRMGPGEWMNELGQLGLQLPGGVNPKDRLFRCNLWSQDSFITQDKLLHVQIAVWSIWHLMRRQEIDYFHEACLIPRQCKLQYAGKVVYSVHWWFAV